MHDAIAVLIISIRNRLVAREYTEDDKKDTLLSVIEERLDDTIIAYFGS